MMASQPPLTLTVQVTGQLGPHTSGESNLKPTHPPIDMQTAPILACLRQLRAESAFALAASLGPSILPQPDTGSYSPRPPPLRQKRKGDGGKPGLTSGCRKFQTRALSKDRSRGFGWGWLAYMDSVTTRALATSGGAPKQSSELELSASSSPPAARAGGSGPWAHSPLLDGTTPLPPCTSPALLPQGPYGTSP